MGLFSWLFGSRKPEPQPPPAPPVVDVVTQFAERVVVTGPHVAQRIPPPGHITAEVVDRFGAVLAMDTFAAPRPAPVCTWVALDEYPATKYIVPVGAEDHIHQQVDIPLPYVHRLFQLPAHMNEKPGATTVRIWWSCENG